jgi:hypothetical protein
MKFKDNIFFSFILIPSIFGITIYLSIKILSSFLLDLAKFILSNELSVKVINEVDSDLIIILKIIAIISLLGGTYFLHTYLLGFLKNNVVIYLLPIIIIFSFYLGRDLINNYFNDLSILYNKYYVYYHFNVFQSGTDPLNLIYKSSNKIKLPLFYYLIAIYLGLVVFSFLRIFTKNILEIFKIKLNGIIKNVSICFLICFCAVLYFNETALAAKRNYDFDYYSKFNPKIESTNLEKPNSKLSPKRDDCTGTGNEGCISMIRKQLAKTGKNILGEQYLGNGIFGISFMDSQHPGVYDATISTDCNCNIIDTKVKAVR